MKPAQIKTLEDLPHFQVSGITQGETYETGYTDFELSGSFDRIDGVTEGRCWLLLPERNCLIGDLKSLDPETKTAVYSTAEESIPKVVGLRLPYLHDNWQAYHVWMVVEPAWIWNEVVFQPTAATARRFRAEEVDIVDGQEVKEWIEIKSASGDSGRSRICPVFPDGRTNLPEIGPDGLISGGWDHEHCTLCRTHIEPGHTGYVDRSEHWVCEKCYRKYVLNHDLSFLDIA